jgi:5-methylcytosine-specific restriction protein A
MPIALTVNDVVTREQLNQTYGGGIHGGMLTPAGGELMFLFSIPSRGALYGYDFDGWESAEQRVFAYTGEGTGRHQRFVRRNRILRDAAVEGREVHLFIADGRTPGSAQKRQRYAGRVEVDPVRPYRVEVGMDGFDKIVFRLRRVDQEHVGGAAEQSVRATVAEDSESSIVAGEDRVVDTFQRAPSGGGESRRDENKLVQAYARWAGIEYRRLALRIEGEAGRFYTDLWDSTRAEIVEAKGSASRHAVRAAIGHYWTTSYTPRSR